MFSRVRKAKLKGSISRSFDLPPVPLQALKDYVEQAVDSFMTLLHPLNSDDDSGPAQETTKPPRISHLLTVHESTTQELRSHIVKLQTEGAAQQMIDDTKSVLCLRLVQAVVLVCDSCEELWERQQTDAPGPHKATLPTHDNNSATAPNHEMPARSEDSDTPPNPDHKAPADSDDNWSSLEEPSEDSLTDDNDSQGSMADFICHDDEVSYLEGSPSEQSWSPKRHEC